MKKAIAPPTTTTTAITMPIIKPVLLLGVGTGLAVTGCTEV